MTCEPEPVGEVVDPSGALSRVGRLFQVTEVGSKGPTLKALNTPPAVVAELMVSVAESTVDPAGRLVANWRSAR